MKFLSISKYELRPIISKLIKLTVLIMTICFFIFFSWSWNFVWDCFKVKLREREIDVYI